MERLTKLKRRKDRGLISWWRKGKRRREENNGEEEWMSDMETKSAPTLYTVYVRRKRPEAWTNNTGCCIMTMHLLTRHSLSVNF